MIVIDMLAGMDERVDLHLLRQFLAVAEELHFGRAAERLGMAQPPLSQRIRYLETLLGFSLFTRTSRVVRLTAAGAALRDSTTRLIVQITGDVDEATRIAHGEIGSLSIGYVVPAMLTFLPSLIRGFRDSHPGVHVRLREMSTAPQLAALRDGSLDAGFVTEPPAAPDIAVWLTWQEPFVAVLPASHALTKRPRITIEALASSDFILFPAAQAPELHRKIVQLCRDHGVEPRIVQEAQSWQMIASLVAAGLGVSIAPASIARFRIPRVRYAPLPKKLPTITTALCTCRGIDAPVVRAFVDAALTFPRA